MKISGFSAEICVSQMLCFLGKGENLPKSAALVLLGSSHEARPDFCPVSRRKWQFRGESSQMWVWAQLSFEAPWLFLQCSGRDRLGSRGGRVAHGGWRGRPLQARGTWIRYFRNPCDRDPPARNFKNFKFFKNSLKILNVYFWGTSVYFWGPGVYFWGTGVYFWGTSVYFWG